jgi:tRNA(adenine34) deaminase
MPENDQELIDHKWMKHALKLAQNARVLDEVPVGAVLVKDNEVIGEGWNQAISACDPTAHAEVVALRNAAKRLNNYRVVNTTLYVTLEPCAMCLGALVHGRVQRLVYAASEPKSGAVNLLELHAFNHHIDVISGVLAAEASVLLKSFFKNKRKLKKEKNFP